VLCEGRIVDSLSFFLPLLPVWLVVSLRGPLPIPRVRGAATNPSPLDLLTTAGEEGSSLALSFSFTS